MIIAFMALLFPGTAFAYSYTVSEESDLYFTIDNDNTLVVIYGNSNRECNQPGADPYLWVYEDGVESSGALIVANDDGNHGQGQCVSSKIYTTLDAGDYRLRAGYCCSLRGLGSNPSGYDYEIVTDLTFDGVSPNTPTTTTTSTTTTSTTTSTTTTTTTTTIPQTIGPPMNLTGSIVEVWVGEQVSGGVYLDWDPPNTGNVDPERYAISFRIPPDAGWGVATGNAGDANALNTEYTLPFSIFASTGGFGEEYVFDVRADNDTLGVYSGWSTQVTLTVEEPTPPTTTTTTTTTTSTTTTTTTVPPTTTTTTTTVAPTTTTSTSTTTTLAPTITTTTVAPTTTTTEVPPSTTTTTTTSTTTTVPPTTSTTTTTTTSSTTTTVLPTTTSTTVLPSTTTTVAPVSSVAPAPPAESTTSLPSPTPTTSIPLTLAEERAEETKAEFENLGIDTEGVNLVEVDEAEVKIVEELDKLDEELAEDFLDVVDGDVTVEELEKLITDDKFEEISDDAQQILVAAVNEADDEVKDTFQKEVNIFSDKDFGEYVPLGSNINVEQRRVIVAAGATIMAAAAPAAGGGRRKQ